MTGSDPVSGDWREFRPAIWLSILGIALVALVSPPYFGAVLIGASIGVAARVMRRRRQRRQRRR
jgi:predicted branched-subunit amino acid permease